MSYGFTSEYQQGYTDLLYLRARHYSTSTGRFLTRDTWSGDANNPLSFNRWGYTEGNPVNQIDSTGLFSVNTIAESYGVTVSQLIEAAETGRYIPSLKNKWGWLKLLLEASNGQTVQIGTPALFPPFLDMYPRMPIEISGNTITIGGISLLAYNYGYLTNPMMPGTLWWRNSTPNHYLLDNVEYFDNRHDLPDFRTISADALFLGEAYPPIAILSMLADVGGSVTIDRYGNVYGPLFAMLAPSLGGSPVSI